MENVLDLKLVCEPLFSNSNILSRGYSERELVNSGFINEEVRICIPLGTIESYQQEDEKALTLISEYLKKRPPYFTSVRFTDSKGKEPAYVQVSPVLEKQDARIWNHIYRLWPTLIKKLMGQDNVCYLSGDILLRRDLSRTLPKDYDGKVIFRGLHPDVPALVECTRRFMEMGELQPREGMMSPHIWNYGTLGYILPRKKEKRLQEWASAVECTMRIVTDFFETIKCVFWVRYELEGIWIMSPRMTTEEICEHIS